MNKLLGFWMQGPTSWIWWKCPKRPTSLLIRSHQKRWMAVAAGVLTFSWTKWLQLVGRSCNMTRLDCGMMPIVKKRTPEIETKFIHPFQQGFLLGAFICERDSLGFPTVALGIGGAVQRPFWIEHNIFPKIRWNKGPTVEPHLLSFFES